MKQTARLIAVGLLAAALGGCGFEPAWTSTEVAGANVCDVNGRCAPDVLSASSDKVATIELRSVAPGTRLSLEWMYGGDRLLRERVFYPTSAPSRLVTRLGVPWSRTFRHGTYTLSIKVDGRKVRTVTFRVAGPEQ